MVDISWANPSCCSSHVIAPCWRVCLWAVPPSCFSDPGHSVMPGSSPPSCSLAVHNRTGHVQPNSKTPPIHYSVIIRDVPASSEGSLPALFQPWLAPTPSSGWRKTLEDETEVRIKRCILYNRYVALDSILWLKCPISKTKHNLEREHEH